MARISVLGGTGYSGGAVVKEAAGRGHQVTSVSRHEPDERIDGVDYVIGSVLDGDVLAAAVADHDVVIEAVSPRGDMSGRVEGVVDQLVELAPRAGARLGVIGGVSSLKVEGVVDRLVELAPASGTRLGVIGGVSSLLVEEGGPRVFDVNEPDPGVLPEIETGLALLEILKAAPEGVDWFYVSPPLSYGAWAPAPDTGGYRLSDEILLKDDEGNSTISAADLARAIVDEIEQPQYRRRRFHAAH